MAHLKFAPITSVDAERSFLKSKYLSFDNRCSVNFDNIKYAVIVQYNNFD